MTIDGREIIERAESAIHKLSDAVLANDNKPWDGVERRKKVEIFGFPLFSFHFSENKRRGS